MINTILTMWQEAVARLNFQLLQWYDSIIEPVALVLGVALVLTLIKTIYNFIRGTSK